jgi:hypothetical protein
MAEQMKKYKRPEDGHSRDGMESNKNGEIKGKKEEEI